MTTKNVSRPCQMLPGTTPVQSHWSKPNSSYNGLSPLHLILSQSLSLLCFKVRRLDSSIERKDAESQQPLDHPWFLRRITTLCDCISAKALHVNPFDPRTLRSFPAPSLICLTLPVPQEASQEPGNGLWVLAYEYPWSHFSYWEKLFF